MLLLLLLTGAPLLGITVLPTDLLQMLGWAAIRCLEVGLAGTPRFPLEMLHTILSAVPLAKASDLLETDPALEVPLRASAAAAKASAVAELPLADGGHVLCAAAADSIVMGCVSAVVRLIA